LAKSLWGGASDYISEAFRREELQCKADRLKLELISSLGIEEEGHINAVMATVQKKSLNALLSKKNLSLN